ncbi:MAG: DUF1573 domain-containing protein [Pirellulales bacterium]|nr:DUF1573 domain-containing protein [Pirellulales bacterium]
MRRSMILMLILVVFHAAPALADHWAADMFETTKHDFGTVARGAKAEFKFNLKNPYLEDVHIAGVRSSCGCTQVRVEKETLKTYETGAIIATINTQSFWGNRSATLTVTFDKPYYAEVQLHDTVYIRSDLVLEPGSVVLGEVDQGRAIEKKIAVSHSGGSDWRIVDVRSDNPYVSGKAVNGRDYGGQVSYDLVVRIDPKTPAGYLRDHLMLVTNDQQMSQVPVLVEGQVVSDLTISPAPLFLGVVQPGEKVQKQVVLRAKKPFKILSVDCKDHSFQFGKTNNSEAKNWHLVPVTFVGGNQKGKIAQTIHIQTDLGNGGTELPAFAVVADPSN